MAMFMKNTWLVFLVCFCCSPGVRPSMAADEAICPENFPKEIRKVTDNVHVAIGYAIANCIMVIAPEGLIIVDVTETVNASKEIFDDFRNISSKPIKAIIYTHYHHDHIMGAKTFVEDPTNPPEIWADIKLLETIEKFQTHAFAIRYVRATRQFGNFVNDTNGGLGNKLDQGEEGFVFPNKFVDNHTVEATIADQVVELVKLPSMLANESYLQQCYGTVPWSSKGVFQLYLGWFSGDPIDLFPMTYTEKAKRMQNLTGGINGLVRNARKALRSGDNQWALELSSYALELNPDNFRARNLKRKALYALGEATSLTLANNYYKTFSLELRNGVAIISDSQPKSDAIYEIVYANENLYREFVFSMSVGAGWPYDGGLPFGIELTPPFTMSSFKDIMYCFDWYLNAKID
ncbi:hypothetical protein KUTeg_011353 [Tegillarca granosa]|uniref:Metallo-beta-lactamase domain-containing protein n=1 Tax=Tegillarca granosa TaxID=220873 RepID=A0ABQ9F4F8_TEGGR|nr:hypothetical protein KUTeg_011353 [Tegillarca granosa]